jgi:hypothetical protein
MTISDGLTQGMKIVGHALHLAIVVANVQVTLHEDVKPGVELQNVGPKVVIKLSLECEPCLTRSLSQFSNDLM